MGKRRPRFDDPEFNALVETFKDVRRVARRVADRKSPAEITDHDIAEVREVLERNRRVIDLWVARDPRWRKQFGDGPVRQILVEAKDDRHGTVEAGRQLVSVLKLVLMAMTGQLLVFAADSLFDELGVDELVSLFTREGVELVDTAIEQIADSLDWLVSEAADALQTLEDINRLYRDEVVGQVVDDQPVKAASPPTAELPPEPIPGQQDAARKLNDLADRVQEQFPPSGDAIHDAAIRLEVLAADVEELPPSGEAIQAAPASVVLPDRPVEVPVDTTPAGTQPTDPRGSRAPEPSLDAAEPRS